MDFVEINKFTQDKKMKASRDALYAGKINKIDALRLIVYASKRLYGIKCTASIIHSLGVDKIDLSV